MIAVVIAVLVLLVLGVVENAAHQHMLKKIPLRILVNGTRGKTTVTRMTASVLNAAGIRTYAKTTGSEARRILPDGTEEAYRKHDFVTMMEQLPFVRLAVKGKAQAIVVECMAQRMENQRLMGEKLIRPHWVLMTNAYVDHVEEIGATEEETVHVLAQSISAESKVIAHDERFAAYTSQLIQPNEADGAQLYAQCSFPVHPANVQLVEALAAELGIAAEVVRQGILDTKPDIGMYKKFEASGCTVWNAFAANDPVSFAQTLEECAQRGSFRLLYNHRKDRSYRLEAFAQVVRKCSVKPECIGIIGDDKDWCTKYMTRMTGVKTQAVHQADKWICQPDAAQQVLCAGNIKGEGRMLLEKLMEEAQKNV